MLARIRDAEHSQHVAELSQKISQLEMKVSWPQNVFHQQVDVENRCFFSKPQNEQMVTEGELSMVEDSDRVRELQDRIAELKAEV